MKFSVFVLVVVFIFLLFVLLLFLGGLYDLSFFSKGSPFECGFQSFTLSGIPFSIRFFAVSLIFIIFDVEVLIICFYPFFYVFSSRANFYIFGVIAIIFFATLYEWVSGVLNWF